MKDEKIIYNKYNICLINVLTLYNTSNKVDKKIYVLIYFLQYFRKICEVCNQCFSKKQFSYTFLFSFICRKLCITNCKLMSHFQTSFIHGHHNFKKY